MSIDSPWLEKRNPEYEYSNTKYRINLINELKRVKRRLLIAGNTKEPLNSTRLRRSFVFSCMRTSMLSCIWIHRTKIINTTHKTRFLTLTKHLVNTFPVCDNFNYYKKPNNWRSFFPSAKRKHRNYLRVWLCVWMCSSPFWVDRKCMKINYTSNQNFLCCFMRFGFGNSVDFVCEYLPFIVIFVVGNDVTDKLSFWSTDWIASIYHIMQLFNF